MKTFDAVIPYDPVDDVWFINGVGSNEGEAQVNVDLCTDSDGQLNRLQYVKCRIFIEEVDSRNRNRKDMHRKNGR